MADYISDSPNPSAPQSNNQRTPSAQQKRGNHNQRSRKNNPNYDGAVSDGFVAHAPGSPHSRKTPKQRQQSLAIGQQNSNNMGGSVQKPRPISVAGPNMAANSPAKDQIYAGAKFQDSPAASSLPMPKFFSRSLPRDAAGRNTLQAKLAQERGQTAGNGSSPESDSASPVPQPPRNAQQSPLDFFFQADRAEKEKHRSESISKSPQFARGGAQAPTPASAVRNPLQQPGRNVFLSELDGDDSDRLSPRTARPPFEHRAQSSPGAPAQLTPSESDRQAKTQSLKNILWSTTANPSSTPPASLSRNNSGSQTPDAFFGSPSPFQRSSGPSTPQPTTEQQQNHYSLHYGNRNLSPLFKAARSDTPPQPQPQFQPQPRPSSLRQELGSDQAFNANQPSLDFRHQHAPYQGSNDHSAFARSYLNEQIRSSGPAQMPELPWQSGPKPVHASSGTQMPNNPSSGSVSIPVQPVNAQHGVPASGTSASESGNSTPRSGGGSRDIDAMNNDLRRMLKLNVVS